jgi:C2 domain
MKNTLIRLILVNLPRFAALAGLLVAGCGTSDPRTWEPCTDARCNDPSATFDVIADGADITGSYDVIGPPDPYLCVTLLGATHCSSEISDTSSPRWSETIVRAATVADLTGNPIAVNLWDQDTGGLDTNDFICGTELRLTTDDLDAGGASFDCGSGTQGALRFHFTGDK